MIRFLWRLCRLVIALVVLGAVAYFGSGPVLAALGRYLVTSEPLAKCELVVVLSGEPFLRVPEAARLYHDGFAPVILITNEPRPPGLDDLRRIGIRFPDSQEISLQLLTALKVPAEAVRAIQERPINTREEADMVARFLKAHPARSLIIVTSKSHTTRSQKIFRSRLGGDVRVTMHAVTSDPFDPNAWWRDRLHAKQVLHEYQGLADFWRGEIWGRIWRQPEPPPVVTVH